MRLSAIALSAALLFPAGLLAQPASGHSAQHATSAAGTTGHGEGEVRKVDRAAKKLTLRHGPIAGLDMPAMTMVSQVSDPALLDRIRPGERVRFRVEKRGGAYFVIAVEPAQ